MKNFKKILSGVLVASAMASCLAIPTYADVVYDDVTATVDEYGCTTYQLPDDFTIQTVLEDKDKTLVLNGKKFVVLKEYTIDHNEDAFFPEDRVDYTCEFVVEGNDKTYFAYQLRDIKNTPENKATNKTIEEVTFDLAKDPTVGDSTTVGESEPTGVRGDINYDGKVTTVDLLLLKKYLLGIVKW